MQHTRIVDIDGTILKHAGDMSTCVMWARNNTLKELLPNVIETFRRWDRNNDNIILLTGRRESMRRITEEQLAGFGLFYDQLVMGVGNGPRVLYNDYNKCGETKAFALNLERDSGFTDNEDI